MSKGFKFDLAGIISEERNEPNWHVRLKPNDDNMRISIDIWGHKTGKKEVEELAMQILEAVKNYEQ